MTLFQGLSTCTELLAKILPGRLECLREVWYVGSHDGSHDHEKEIAVRRLARRVQTGPQRDVRPCQQHVMHEHQDHEHESGGRRDSSGEVPESTGAVQEQLLQKRNEGSHGETVSDIASMASSMVSMERCRTRQGFRWARKLCK
jgi:hypothetical protein